MDCFIQDTIFNIKDFYIKRAYAIYPPFYIFNLYILIAMLRHFLQDGNLFFAGNPLKLLLTIAGVDGYAQLFGFNTYYFCGEWFVGAILFLYFLYPAFYTAYSKKRSLLFAILIFGYCAQFALPAILLKNLSALPFILALKFCVGFIVVSNVKYFSRPLVAFACATIFVAITFIDIPGLLNNDCLGFIAAISLFGIVFFIAKQIKIRFFKAIIKKLAVLSYCVFLVQHIVIDWSQMVYIKIFANFGIEFSKPKVAILLVITTIFVIMVAYMLKKVSTFAVTKFLGKNI